MPLVTDLAARLNAHATANPEFVERFAAALDIPDVDLAGRLLWQDVTAATHSPDSLLPRREQEVRTREDATLTLWLLVQLDGWTRVKRCQSQGCSRGYIDPTYAATRKYCPEHKTKPTSRRARDRHA